MSQERYRQYCQELKDQEYNPVETMLNIPTNETFKILEKIFSFMTCDLLKIDSENLYNPKYPSKNPPKDHPEFNL